jgi:hypothetical protein
LSENSEQKSGILAHCCNIRLKKECHSVNETKKKKKTCISICHVTFSSHNRKIIFKFTINSSSFEIYIKISAQYTYSNGKNMETCINIYRYEIFTQSCSTNHKSVKVRQTIQYTKLIFTIANLPVCIYLYIYTHTQHSYI